MTAIRWSDRDRYFGPLTFAPASEGRSSYALLLVSGGDEGARCHLRITVRGHTLLVALPPILPPYREKVFPESWDAATIARLGRNWYWNVERRELGFSLYEGHLSVRYGRQSHDSLTEQSWGCFLPWTQWRHVRHSLYGLRGEHFWTEPPARDWSDYQRQVDACPSRTFAFVDFDGETLTARTRIEEREWRFGTGAFRWLAWFRPAKVRRSLDIEFSGETGPRKGSWKGGTIGHSINMLPGELHAAAFRRYCAAHEMEFRGEVAAPQGPEVSRG